MYLGREDSVFTCGCQYLKLVQIIRRLHLLIQLLDLMLSTILDLAARIVRPIMVKTAINKEMIMTKIIGSGPIDILYS